MRSALHAVLAVLSAVSFSFSMDGLVAICYPRQDKCGNNQCKVDVYKITNNSKGSPVTVATPSKLGFSSVTTLAQPRFNVEGSHLALMVVAGGKTTIFKLKSDISTSSGSWTKQKLCEISGNPWEANNHRTNMDWPKGDWIFFQMQNGKIYRVNANTGAHNVAYAITQKLRKKNNKVLTESFQELRHWNLTWDAKYMGGWNGNHGFIINLPTATGSSQSVKPDFAKNFNDGGDGLDYYPNVVSGFQASCGRAVSTGMKYCIHTIDNVPPSPNMTRYGPFPPNEPHIGVGLHQRKSDGTYDWSKSAYKYSIITDDGIRYSQAACNSAANSDRWIIENKMSGETNVFDVETGDRIKIAKHNCISEMTNFDMYVSAPSAHIIPELRNGATMGHASIATYSTLETVSLSSNNMLYLPRHGVYAIEILDASGRALTRHIVRGSRTDIGAKVKQAGIYFINIRSTAINKQMKVSIWK
ncbi:MAG: hypothetical protein GF398_07730 [Chitinivibrionales bacterium]|nr:hypothetical protein [Chitinivibrionales bacterium]